MNKQPTKSNDVVALAIAKQEELFAAVEQMLFDKAARNETIDNLSSGELLLCSSLGWDRKETMRQIGHHSAMLQLRRQAGSSADRIAAQERLEAATAKLASEGAQLRTELERVIAELKSKIGAMEREVAEANQAVDSQTAAIGHLRKHLPQHVEHAANRATSEAASKFTGAISELDVTIDRIIRLSEIVPTSVEGVHQARLYAAHHPDLLLPRQRNSEQVEINVGKWNEHVGSLKGSLPELRAKLAGLKEAQAAVTLEAQTARDYYLPA